jgi:Uma2 family endonuclease
MNTTNLPPTVSSGNLRITTSLDRHANPYVDSERSFEIVKGKVVEKKMGLIENFIASFMHERLAPFSREHRLGRAVMETMFSIPGSGNDRKPDVAFISYQTWPSDRLLPRVNAWAIAPDLIVEVISPTDKAFDVMEKLKEYFAGGVRQVWQVYSNIEQVFIFDSPLSARILNRADELTGEPVVPGFRMQLAELFPAAEPDTK